VAKERRQFSREFKLAALARFKATGNVEALAQELGIRREMLYRWQAKFAAGELRRCGRRVGRVRRPRGCRLRR
jgi:transposase-like protein